MASTNRRTPVKEKKEVIENLPPKSEASVPDIGSKGFPEYLSPEHLQKIDNIERDFQNKKLSMALEEQVLENMTLKLDILRTNIEVQRGKIQVKASEYNNEVKKFEDFKKEIWPHYGFSIEEGMGYDPKTGKIKRSK